MPTSVNGRLITAHCKYLSYWPVSLRALATLALLQSHTVHPIHQSTSPSTIHHPPSLSAHLLPGSAQFFQSNFRLSPQLSETFEGTPRLATSSSATRPTKSRPSTTLTASSKPVSQLPVYNPGVGSGQVSRHRYSYRRIQQLHHRAITSPCIAKGTGTADGYTHIERDIDIGGLKWERHLLLRLETTPRASRKTTNFLAYPLSNRHESRAVA